MTEPILIGPISKDDVENINVEILQKEVKGKWDTAEFNERLSNKTPLRWTVWDGASECYLECGVVLEHTLSVQSSNKEKVAEAIIWFYQYSHSKSLYMYDANTYLNPIEVTEKTTKNDIVQWIQNNR